VAAVVPGVSSGRFANSGQEVQAVARLEGCHQGPELPRGEGTLDHACHQRCSVIRRASQAAHRPGPAWWRLGLPGGHGPPPRRRRLALAAWRVNAADGQARRPSRS
jgi:hypothetical protein